MTLELKRRLIYLVMAFLIVLAVMYAIIGVKASLESAQLKVDRLDYCVAHGYTTYIYELNDAWCIATTGDTIYGIRIMNSDEDTHTIHPGE